MRVRRGRIKDALRLRNLYLASVRGLCRKDYAPAEIRAWLRGRQPEHWRQAMKQGDVMFVAEAGSRLAGFSSVRDREISAVYIHPAFARRKLGSRLLEKAERFACRQGHRSVYLRASLTAYPFYLAHGYNKIRRFRYCLLNGARLPCIQMRKRMS